MAPSPDEIGRQLERLLASEPFTNAERASRFLRYVVERTVAGEGDRLKEFVIGVDVFDRDDRYDPRIDSIVRVEAGRLRTKLDAFYSRAGADDRVVIRIPRGSYVPEFDYRASEPATIASIPTATGRRAGSTRRAVIVAAVAVLVVGALAAVFRSIPELRVGSPSDPAPRVDAADQDPEVRPPVAVQAPAPSAADRSGEPGSAAAHVPPPRPKPRAPRDELQAAGRAGAQAPGPTVSLIVLPFEHFSTDAEAQLLAARFTDGLTSELARIDHVSIVSRTTAVRLDTEGRTLRDIARAVDAQVVIEGSLLLEGTRVDADVRLVDTLVDRKSWSRRFTAEVSNLRALQQRVAADVASFIVPR